MTAMVKLAPGLSVPAAELATQVVAALGMRGSGKSNVMAVIAEELLAARVQVVVLDYVGIWFSLRLMPDGKHPSGLDIPVLGGRHGDIPLVPTAGAMVAQALAESGSPAVLDISEFRKGERARFATDFGEAIFDAKKKHPGPTWLLLEEAQRFVPQVIRFKGEGEERMLGAYMEIAEVGRNYGLGLGLISQRPQKIHKEVLNLSELLFAFQTNGVLERRAISEWVQEKGADGRKDVQDELPGLERGEALVWSPSWLRMFKRTKLPKKSTYDAGATPLAARAQVKTKPLELGALSAAMSTVAEEAKANDPKALKAEVARLRRELEAAGKGGKAAKTPPQVVERVPPALRRALADIVKQATKLRESLARAGDAATDLVGALVEASGAASAAPAAPAATNGHAPRMFFLNETHELPRPSRPVQLAGDAGDLGRAPRALLTAIAQMGGTASDAQISILSGYSMSSSSFANARGELRNRGLIDGPAEARTLTAAGREATKDVPPMPSGRDLLEWWLPKLGKCERAMLVALFENGSLSREALSKATGYSLTSSSFANGLGTLRSARLAGGAHGGDIEIAELFR